jgi:hypothetical protein
MSWQDYLDAGWKLCKIRPGSKGPKGADSTGWDTGTLPFPLDARGAGLVHAFSGTCAVDFDDLERAIDYLARYNIDAQALLKAPDAIQIVSGKPNRAKLLYRLPTPLPSVKLGEYELPVTHPETGVVRQQKYYALELRCATRNGKSVQDVLPPTMHPEMGKPYTWKYGSDVLTDWRELPELPAALRALWQAELGPATTVPQEAPVPKGAASDELLALLRQFSPESGYEAWNRVGMALHHETKGSQDGLYIWNEWSRQATGVGSDGLPKYKGLADLETHWRSYDANAEDAVTIGGLRRELISEPEAFPEAPPDPEPPKKVVPEGTIRTLYDLGRAICYVRSADTYVDLRNIKMKYRSPGHLARAFTPELDPDPNTDKKPNIESYVVLRRDAMQDADDYGFNPGRERLYSAHGMKLLNIYTDKRVEPVEAPTQAREAYEFLWSRIDEQVMRDWVRAFYCFAHKYPGHKIRSAPLLVSTAKGTGKSTIMSTVPKMLFGHVEEFSQSDLEGIFNGKLAEHWWVTFEEICVGEGRAARRKHADSIKGWITNDTMNVRPMYRPSYTIDNHVQFTASSNHVNDALQLDNGKERRWAIGSVNEEILTPKEVTELFSGPDAPFGNTLKARQWLTWWILRADMTGFNPDAAPPLTMAQQRMARGSLGDWETQIVRMACEGTSPFDKDVFTIKDLRDAFAGRPPCDAFIATFLESGLGCQRRRIKGCSVWSWRNHKFWQHTVTQGYIYDHMTTGVRPATLSTEIPERIRQKSTEHAGDIDIDPNADLV